MKMYPKLDLYNIYKKRLISTIFSETLPDVTKKHTLEQMNFAINLADKWDSCIDIGGGTGHYLAALASKFKKAILVEVENLNEQKELVSKYNNISVINKYIEKYTSDETIDFILLADIFEHIPDIESFTQKLSSLQELGGVVYIMTPNPVVCGPAPESALYHTRHLNGHIKQYATTEIVSLMTKAGYTLVLKLYEEAPLRQKLKRIIFALSRRDKNWSKFFLYQFVRPIFLLICLPLFWCIEKICLSSERRYRHSELVARTQDLVFKKISA